MFLKDNTSLVTNLFDARDQENEIPLIPNGQFLGRSKIVTIKNNPSTIKINSTTPLFHDFSITNLSESLNNSDFEIDFREYVSIESSLISSVQVIRHTGVIADLNSPRINISIPQDHPTILDSLQKNHPLRAPRMMWQYCNSFI